MKTERAEKKAQEKQTVKTGKQKKTTKKTAKKNSKEKQQKTWLLIPFIWGCIYRWRPFRARARTGVGCFLTKSVSVTHAGRQM